MSWALVLFFAGIGIGVPIAFALGFAGVAYIAISGQASLNVVPTILFGAMDSFPLLAIPFFIMAGDLMGRCGLLDRMIDFAKALVGPVRAGMAHVTIVSSMVFGGVTGVSLADAAAVGRTLIPGMVREGYPRPFAAAITAASCVMGAIIPPSVAMLIIAYLYGGKLSVGRLFLSGVIPGILIGLTQMAMVAVLAKRKNLPVSPDPWSLKDIVRKFRRALLALGMPVIIIGGIITGFFTPTEAGAVAVAYALIVGSVTGTGYTWRGIADSLLVSAKLTGVIFIMLAASQLFSWLLIINQVPQQLTPWLQPLLAHAAGFPAHRNGGVHHPRHGARRRADHDHGGAGGRADGAAVRGRAASSRARDGDGDAACHPVAAGRAGPRDSLPDRGLHDLAGDGRDPALCGLHRGRDIGGDLLPRAGPGDPALGRLQVIHRIHRRLPSNAAKPAS